MASTRKKTVRFDSGNLTDTSSYRRAAEASRLAALAELDILDSPPESEFDALTQAASVICGTPISLISLVDADRQWFKANVGLPGVSQTARAMSFCAHAIENDDLCEIADATRDARFANNPLVLGDPGIRFYAGAPIRLDDGSRVGTLCVIDRVPRVLDDRQRETLQCLARVASRALEARRAVQLKMQLTSALEVSEQSLRGLYEATPAMLYSIDGEGRLLTVSDRWLAKTGYSRAEVIGRSFLDFLTPENRERCKHVIMPRLLATGRCDDVPCELVLKSGGTIDGLMSAVLERDDAGRPVRRLAVIQDVTERRRVERALHENDQRLGAIVEATGVGTWQWNIQTDVIILSELWAQQLGYSLAELQPMTRAVFEELVHEADRDRMMLHAHHLVGQRTELIESEIRMRHRDGRWVWLLDRGRVTTWTLDGKPEWMFGTHQDITQRKSQEDALRQSEQFLDRTGRVAGVGGWELDVLTREVFWSDETCRIHGLEPGHRPTYAEAIEFYPPQARARIENAIDEAIASGAGWDVELPFVRADGRDMWVRSVGSVIFADEKPARLIGAFQDVSERVAEREALRDARDRVNLATDSGGIGIYEYNLLTGELTIDATVRRHFGLDLDDAGPSLKHWRRCIHPDDLHYVEAAARAAIDGELPRQIEFRACWPDGSTHYLRASALVTRDESGHAVRLIGANWDVTEARRLAAELSAQHELLRVTLQSIGDAVITTDPHGAVTWLNPVAEQMTNWTAAQAKGLPIATVFRIVDEQTRRPTESPVIECLARGRVVGLADHTVLIARGGDEYGIEDSAAPIRGDDGTLLGAVLIFHDVTEQRRLSSEASHRASHDALTGLPNRAAFHERLQRALSDAKRDGALLAVFFVDLDGFKALNDTFGHATGDLVLKAAAERMSAAIRHDDFVARLGGDEFVIISPNLAAEHDAEVIAQNILVAISEPLRLTGVPVLNFAASIGVAVYPADGADPDEILHNADIAMYRSKQSASNGFVRFNRVEPLTVRQETRLERRVFAGIERHEFIPYYQPIIDLATGEIIAFEALARWSHSRLGILPPAQFIEIAEQSRLIIPLGEQMLRAACEQIVRWRTLPIDADAYVSVNVSACQLNDRQFRTTVGDILREVGAEPAKLQIEVTETFFIHNEGNALQTLHDLAQLGVRIAIDDFGIGYSSLNSLQRLPIHTLKIDKSFVRDLSPMSHDAAIVRAVLAMAHSLDLKVIAEGVETNAQLGFLRKEHCDGIQGFLVSRPLPPSEATAFISTFDAERFRRGQRRRILDAGQPINA